jgi:hypothetical protein
MPANARRKPASEQALMRMLWRVCAPAAVRKLSPHQLRHGFANRFLRESHQNVVVLQALMGHKRPDTTQQYTDEIDVDTQANVLYLAAASRHAQASPDWATLAATGTDGPSGPEWRRRVRFPRTSARHSHSHALLRPVCDRVSRTRTGSAATDDE